MKVKSATARISSAATGSTSTSDSIAPSGLLTYTDKTSVRSSLGTNDSYAIDLSLNSTGTHLAVLTVPTTIQLFDASTLTSVTSLSSTSYNFDGPERSTSITASAIRFAVVSPHTLFASTNKNLVLAWDTRTPQQEVMQLNGDANSKKFLSVACNNEDQLIAAGSELKGQEDVGIALWDIRAPSEKRFLHCFTESHSDDIIQLEFSRISSNKLLSGSTDGLVCLYDAAKSDEDDALEEVFNANGPIGKCGFAHHNTIYAITASNEFFIWSTTEDNQELLVQGDTEVDEVSSATPAATTTEAMDTLAASSTKIHHLPFPHATIVDLLTGMQIRDLLPSIPQPSDLSWPFLLCDHTGKMSLTLVSSGDTEPMLFNLESPHSEPLRSALAYRSSIYTCGDDGQVVRWQPSTSSSSTSTNEQPSKASRSKAKGNSTKPY